LAVYGLLSPIVEKEWPEKSSRRKDRKNPVEIKLPSRYGSGQPGNRSVDLAGGKNGFRTDETYSTNCRDVCKRQRPGRAWAITGDLNEKTFRTARDGRTGRLKGDIVRTVSKLVGRRPNGAGLLEETSSKDRFVNGGEIHDQVGSNTQHRTKKQLSQIPAM